MKYFACSFLMLLFLSACGSPTAESTLPPAATDIYLPQTTSCATTPTSKPIPPEDLSLSYEDFFAQRVEYIDTNSDEPYFSPAGWNPYASTPEAAPGLALAQELVTEDTLGWIPLTLSYTPDGNLYAFWSGTEEGASLYRLYYPTKALDLIYTISAEELEQYYYTPQTEATAYLFRSNEHPNGVVGEQVCLMGYVDIYTNQEFLWGSYDPEFLALFDDIAAHQEDYPQYPWGYESYDDIAFWVEDRRLTLTLCHYYNAAGRKYQVRHDSYTGAHDYWWTTE